MAKKTMEMSSYKKDKPFIIAKYVAKALTYQNNEYEQIFNPGRVSITISRDKAKQIIEEYDMIEVFRNDDGVIWETPDHAFFNKFKGFFHQAQIKEMKEKEALIASSKIEKVSEIKNKKK